MKIVALYEKKNKTIVAFDESNLSLTDLKKSVNINTHYYITINPELTSNSEDVDLDLSLILTETDLGLCTTWEQFKNQMTYEIYTSYNVTIPLISGEGIRQPKICYASNCENAVISYTSIKNPDTRDIFQFRFNLPDLVISLTDNSLDLKNCIVSVNGNVLFTEFFNDELFVLDGAKSLWSCHDRRWPDIVMIDTSPLGGHEIIKLSQCNKKFKNVTNSLNVGSDVEIILPEGKTFKNKTVLMCIANKLYFPESINIASERSVIIKPATLGIHKSLLALKESFDEFERNTSHIISDMSTAEYILKYMWTDDCNGAFLIVIDNPSIVFNRTKCDVSFPQHTIKSLVDPNACVLLQKSTRALVSFVTDKYADHHLLYISEPGSLYSLDVDAFGIQYATAVISCTHDHGLTNFSDSSYELISMKA